MFLSVLSDVMAPVKIIWCGRPWEQRSFGPERGTAIVEAEALAEGLATVVRVELRCPVSGGAGLWLERHVGAGHGFY